MLLKKNLINDWIDFLDNGDMAAYIIKEVKSIETGKDYLKLTCRAEETIRKCWDNYYNTSLPQLIATGDSKEIQVIIRFINSRVFNFKMGFSIAPEINKTPMISDDFACDGAEWNLREEENSLTVTAGELKLVINRACFGLTVYGSDGKLITRHAPYDLTGGE